MKTIITLLFSFFSFTSYCFAQDDIEFKIDEFFNPEKIKVPFKEIIVKDARFDKTKIGCIYNKVVLGMHTYKKRNAIFPDSLHSYLPKLIESFSTLDNSSHQSLYILVKKFRVAENFMTSMQNTVNNYFTLNISASFYSVSDDKYKKLYSIDDVISEYVDVDFDVKLSLQYLKNQRSSILTKMLYKKLAYINWEAGSETNGFTAVDIDAAIEKRFMLPVYRQQAIKGLYKTFTEFKNATPSVTNITVNYKGNKVGDITDENGNKVLIQNYWGISDGKKNYMMFRNELTELIPCDKSFRILSYRTSAELLGKSIVGDGRNTGFFGVFTGGNKIDEYFDLDMDTGDLFLEEVSGKSKLRDIKKDLLK